MVYEYEYFEALKLSFFYEIRNYFGLVLLTGQNSIRICLEKTKYNFKSLIYKYKASTIKYYKK